MEPKQTTNWEARNEQEIINALDVLYEMATGYVLSELRDQAPDVYAGLTARSRTKNQLANNVRYSIDCMLEELVKEYTSGPEDEEE